jgi:hypothetical protein
MNNFDHVIVYPEGEPERKARAIVAVVSANQRSIAVGFDERPPFEWGEPLAIAVHPHFGLMLFAGREAPRGAWSEMMSQKRFVIDEVIGENAPRC